MTEGTESKGYEDDNSHMAARTGDMVQIINGRGEFMFVFETLSFFSSFQNSSLQ